MRAAPIKASGKKRDHSTLKCHYCGKMGHIRPNCQKKKKDEAEEKKKTQGNASGSGSGAKPAVNSHVLVPTSASITEVDDIVGVALYTASRVRWMMDSGASHHMTPHRSDFATYTPCMGKVKLGDLSLIDHVGIGSVIIKTSSGPAITLGTVLHVPVVDNRFISTPALTEKGAEIVYSKNSCKIVVNQRPVAVGYKEAGLFWIDNSASSLNTVGKSASTSLDIWHQRMGHISHNTLKSHGPSALAGMDLDSSTTVIPVCRGCELGKSTRQPFSASKTIRTTRIFEIVHSDLAGPMQTQSIQGSLYTATFIDDHSKHSVIYFIKSKDQFVKALNMFLAWGETQTSHKLRALHSDRGGEYMAATVQDILKQRGIEHHLTMPGSPQSNGKAERFNRTIMDKAMAMSHTAGLSKGFWEYAVHAAVHIYNRSPTRTLKWRTPYELWHSGKVPNVSHLRVFGCMGYMHVPADKRRKLDAKAIEVTLVGYEPDSKGYKLWDRSTHSVRLSRDVTFDESSFPFHQGFKTNPTPMPVTPHTVAASEPGAIIAPHQPILPPTRAPSPTASEEEIDSLLDPKTQRPSTPIPQSPSPTKQEPTTPKREHTTPSSPPPRQRANRVQAFHLPTPTIPLQLAETGSPSREMPGGFAGRAQRSQLLREMDSAPRRTTRAHVPNPRYYNADNAAVRGGRLGQAELLAAAYVGRDPVTFGEVMNSADAEKWREACQYEIDALAHNGTWELSDLPPNRKAVKSKWVFKLKADGHFCA